MLMIMNYYFQQQMLCTKQTRSIDDGGRHYFEELKSQRWANSIIVYCIDMQCCVAII